MAKVEIEALGIDHCAIIPSKDQSYVADYYRITLFILSDKLRYLLQSTVVLATKAQKNCLEKRHYVKQGLQMRREIDT